MNHLTKILSSISFLLISVVTFGQEITEITLVNGDTIKTTACKGTIYDDGGKSGDYANNVTAYALIQVPSGATITFTFPDPFNINDGGDDNLGLFNGITTATGARLSGTPSGGIQGQPNATAGPFTSSTGTVLVRWSTNTTGTNTGFKMDWSTSTAPTSVMHYPDTIVCFGDLALIYVDTALNSGKPLSITWYEDDTLSAPLAYTNDTIYSDSTVNYYLVVEDVDGCRLVDSATVIGASGPSALTLSALDTINSQYGYAIACNGDSTGQVKVNVTGGTGTVHFDWWTGSIGSGWLGLGADDDTILLSPGTYFVTAYDDLGCRDTAGGNINVNEPATPLSFSVAPNVTTSYNGSHITCDGVSDADATATATGSFNAYHYEWGTTIGGNGILDDAGQTGASSPAGATLAADWYYVTVTDSAGCQIVDSVEVVSPGVTLSNMDSVQVTTNGGNNGLAITAPTQGTSPYTFQWYYDDAYTAAISGKTNDTLIGIAGPKYVRVRDANLCTIYDSITVTEVEPLNPGAIRIFGGATSVQVCETATPPNVVNFSVASSGSGAPFTYVWQTSSDGLNWTTTATTGSGPFSSGAISATTFVRRKAMGQAGDSAFSNIVTWIYRANPNVSLLGFDTSYCENHGNVTMIGFPVGSGGTYWVDGSVDDSIFNTLTEGDQVNMQVKYVYNDGYCSDSVVKYVDILNVQPIDFTIEANIFVDSDSNFYPLSGSPSIASSGSGYFTGDGVIGDSTFVPAYVLTPGNINITYTIPTHNGNGCPSTATKTISVTGASAGTLTNLITNYCQSVTQSSLISIPPVNGEDSAFFVYMTGPQYVNFYNSSGIFPNDANGNISPYTGYRAYYPDTIRVYPSSLAAGTYTIYYYYVKDTLGAPLTYPYYGYRSATFTVSPLPSNFDASNLSTTYCKDDGALSLNVEFDAFNSEAQLTRISLDTCGSCSFSSSGNGLTTNTLNYNPGHFSTGKNNALSFTVTDERGCISLTQFYTSVYTPVSPANISITDSLESSYCGNSLVDTLVYSSVYLGTYSFTGNGLTEINDSAVFDPGAAVVGYNNYTVTYTDTTPGACTTLFTDSILVLPFPIVNFGIGSIDTSTIPSTICFEDTFTLIGNNSNGVYKFSGHPWALDTTIGANKAFFSTDSLASEGSYEIKYLADSVGCLDSVSKSIFVYKLPNPVILSAVDTIQKCESSVPFVIAANYDLAHNSWWTDPHGAVGKITSGVNQGNANYTPTSAFPGYNKVVLRVENPGTGCENKDSIYIQVNVDPTVSFDVLSYCMSDTILLQDSSTIDTASFVGAGQYMDSIVSWYWNFGYGSATADSGTLVAHKFPNAQTYGIDLTITTAHNCALTGLISRTFGDNPNSNFDFTTICLGDSAELTLMDDVNAEDVSFNWNFNDGNTSINSNPTHLYATEGSYDVTLSRTTSFGCIDSTTKTLNVLPLITSYPYYQNFESGNEGWFSSYLVGQTLDSLNSWELGTPVADSATINTAASGLNAWVTNLSGPFEPSEKSYVSSPCFVVNDLQKPMLKFNYWSEFNAGDGAVLQYSTDRGNTWNTVGTVNSGIEWYDQAGLSQNPGFQSVNQYGWTGSTGGWTDARHVLDDEVASADPNVGYIQFRIAMGGSSNLNNGFAFDDIWIGERYRTVLVETFENYLDNRNGSDKTKMNSILDNNLKDVVGIRYHTNTPANEEFYEDNFEDNSGRATYYSAYTGFAAMDGNQFEGAIGDLTDASINLRSLADTKFLIEVNDTVINNQVQVEVIVEAIDSVVGQELYLQVAVIEDSVDNPLTTVSEREVLRLLLPDASGTLLTQNWSIGQSQTFTFTSITGNISDLEQIETIAFIQAGDGEVMQAATSAPVIESSVTISVEPITAKEQIFNVYPNPTKTNVNISFGGDLEQDHMLRIYDHKGMLVDELNIARGVYGISMNIDDLSGGLYFLNLFTESNLVGNKKLIVIK